MLKMELPGRRKSVRPQKIYGYSEGEHAEDARNRVRWRQIIRCSVPLREQPKEEVDSSLLNLLPLLLLFLQLCSIWTTCARD